jgi:hypothetical protein
MDEDEAIEKQMIKTTETNYKKKQDNEKTMKNPTQYIAKHLKKSKKTVNKNLQRFQIY